MRALLLLGPVYPDQLGLWEQVAATGVDLHVAGTLNPPGEETIPQRIGRPAFGSFHELSAVAWSRRGTLWWTYRRLRDVVATVDPDLVHVWSEPWGLLVSQALRSHGVVVPHGVENLWDQGARIERAVRRAQTRRNLRRCSGFASWNPDGIAWARQRGLPPAAPSVVVSAELPGSGFAPSEELRERSRGERGLGDRFVIGYVGRFVPEKGVSWLLHAAAQLTDRRPLLMMVGAGETEAAMVEEAARHGVELLVVPPVPLGEIPAILSCLDVLAVPSLTTPSWKEQFGRVAVEAMFMGLPVVVSDSGALPAVVGSGGTVVPEGDVTELATAIRRLMDDRHLSERAGRSAREWAVANYAPATSASRVVGFWERVVEYSRARST